MPDVADQIDPVADQAVDVVERLVRLRCTPSDRSPRDAASRSALALYQSGTALPSL